MKIHIVKKGDTLYALSQKYGVPLQTIIETNPQISNPDILAVGEKVKIPTASTPVPDSSDIYYKHTVKQGDSLWKLSKAWGVNLQDMIAANPQLKNPNALMVGEVVNIPKKESQPSGQPMQAPIQAPMSMSVDDKVQPEGKTFTGPIEQPAKVIQPPVTPVPIQPAEVAPVQEMVHTETQSLYVQISVPAQEAVTYHEMPPAPVTKTAPSACDKTAGYPGLTENPNFYDCPATYPLYEQMPNMGMNAPMGQVQPYSYDSNVMTPYFHPANTFPAQEVQGAWQPNAEPGYPDASMGVMGANINYPYYSSPQYGEQYPNMPWPTSCGCSGTTQAAPVQSYADNAPMGNAPMYGSPMGNAPMYGTPMGNAPMYSSPMGNAPMYDSPMGNAPMYGNLPMYSNQPAFNPYDTGMQNINPQHGLHGVTPNMYTTPMVSNIPSMPEYPLRDNEQQGFHSRISELLQSNSEQETIQSGNSDSISAESETTSGTSVGKSPSPKVKTSSRASKTNKSEQSKAQRSSKTKGSTPSKKRRNPWISN